MDSIPIGTGRRWADVRTRLRGGLHPGLPHGLQQSLWALMMLTVAVLGGLLIGLAGLWAAVLLVGALLFVPVMLLPWSWLLALLLLLVFTVIGPLQYLAGMGKAFWLAYGLAALLGVRLLVDAAAGAGSGWTGVLRPGPGSQAVRLALAGLALAVTVSVLAGLAAGIAPMQWLVGGKEWFLLWGVPAAFMLGLLNWRGLQRLWAWSVAWLWLQLPVVVWQRFAVAPRRGGDSPWDAVVGLFAGQAWGGGGSGTMALLSLWAASLVVMAWRAGQARGGWAVAAVLPAAAACALAEVKVALVLLPVLGVAAAWPSGIHKPDSAPGWRGAALLTLAAIGLSVALLLAHQAQFGSARSGSSQTVEGYVAMIVERNVDDTVMADPHGQLTRVGALKWWWQRQQAADVPGWLIGHGPGASRRSMTAVGELARGSRVDLARSSASVLLWETGVVGLLGWAVGLGAMSVAAWQMRRVPALQPHGWLLQAAAALGLLGLLSLPYGADFFAAPHLPVALMVGMGIVLGARRELAGVCGDLPMNEAGR